MAPIWAACSPARAGDGVYLPAPPVGPGGEDSITTSDGVRCSQSINSNAGYLDIGVVGGDLSSYGASYGAGATPQSAIGYARIVVPLGAAPKRLDCTALYELEIRKLKTEIEQLKIGLQ